MTFGFPLSGPGSAETVVSRPWAPGTPGGQGLPEDLLREASRRLAVLCLISAFIWAANLLLVNFVYALPGTVPADRVAAYWKWRPVYDCIGVANILVSLGLFWYNRRSKSTARFLLDLALVYEVFTALSVALLDYAEPGPTEGVSWIAVIILLFAPMVPSTPRKTVVAAFAAASMGPLAALIWQALGAHVPSVGQVLLLSIPNYLCAGIAGVIAHIMHRLGGEVRKAREMGSYVLGDLIARGGMGEVWRATHRFLARPAAIKLIKPEVLGAVTPEQAQVVVQRFRREAEAAAMLRSPHTIQLYDFGVANDGTFYYVMELLSGMDLHTLVSRHGSLPPGRAIHILRQVCESLGEAHDRGLVHRDIKPANIHLCRRGRDCDYVKVLDFGLVKRFAPGGAAELALTTPNMLAGTPAFLAPESASGEPVDHRIDIYSLGCVAYWMLTGRQVFQADGVVQMIARHLQTVPEPPSRYSGLPIPVALDRLVLACLAKRPSDRPESAWEMEGLLERCQTESPWSREDSTNWWQTRLEPEALVSLVD
ncbi:MAG: eukaryotic-like serine/threonine-protein kinase [Gemmatimonadales bacterium]|nr:eukaryotic-like serine/threonine-protein kinase [Gemmatimonadales bacterium]